MNSALYWVDCWVWSWAGQMERPPAAHWADRSVETLGENLVGSTELWKVAPLAAHSAVHSVQNWAGSWALHSGCLSVAEKACTTAAWLARPRAVHSDGKWAGWLEPGQVERWADRLAARWVLQLVACSGVTMAETMGQPTVVCWVGRTAESLAQRSADYLDAKWAVPTEPSPAVRWAGQKVVSSASRLAAWKAAWTAVSTDVRLVGCSDSHWADHSGAHLALTRAV